MQVVKPRNYSSVIIIIFSLASIIVGLVFGKAALGILSENFIREFQLSNANELSAGNTFEVGLKLNFITTRENIKCVRGVNNGKIFYSSSTDTCRSGLFTELKKLSVSGNKNLEISFEIGLPFYLQTFLGIFLLLQVCIFLSAGLLMKNQADREKRQFQEFSDIAAHMAHDIRSPISALRTAAISLDKRPEASKKLLLKATDRIQNIAEDLLKKINPHKDLTPQSITNERFDLVCELRDLIEEKRVEFQHLPKLVIKASLPTFPIFISREKYQILRILSNLINNSVEAIEKNKTGAILVTLSYNNNILTLTVKDNGKGIPNQVLHKLEHRPESFGKLNSANSGYGLGLVHARRVVNKFNGSISISSKPGVGTEVTILVPV